MMGVKKRETASTDPGRYVLQGKTKGVLSEKKKNEQRSSALWLFRGTAGRMRRKQQCDDSGAYLGGSDGSCKRAESSAEETTAAAAESESESAAAASAEDAVIRVGALKGPTSMGLVNMMDEHPEYSYTMENRGGRYYGWHCIG